MSKITLTDLANLQNENTAVSAINGNNATLETAFDNTLSRDGTPPNMMGANLDMNSNRIINLTSPTSAGEPVRLQDLANYATGGTVTFNAVPTGGSTGSVLLKNSGSNYDTVWGGSALSFDKRSDVTTSKIPSAITSIIINRYDVGYPICPAVYTRGSSGSGLALTDAGGSTWDLSSAAVTGDSYAYPDWFGAKRDGTTDDAPAFRSCMSYLKNIAPSTMFLGTGTYLMGSVVSSIVVVCYTGVSIVGEGDGSLIKLKTNIAGGSSFVLFNQLTNTVTDKVDNATYTNFKVDGNVAGNTFNTFMAGFLLTHNTNCTWDNIYFQNWPGSQCISLGVAAGVGGLGVVPTSVRPRVINCRFLDTGNTLISDFSCIYLVSTEYIVSNNWCTQTVQSSIGTAIEVHGTGICNNNVMSNMNKMFNIGAYPDSSSTLMNNYGYSCRLLVTVWDNFPANPNYNTRALISDNIFYGATGNNGYAIDLSNIAGTGTFSYVKVANNYFESLEAAGTANTNGVIFGGKAKSLEVYDNTAVNFPGQFFSQELAAIADTQVLKIHDNVIIDCCRTSNGAVKTAIGNNFPNAYNVVSICGNTFKNTSTIYMINGIVWNSNITATTGRGKIFGNCFFNLNTSITFGGTGRMEGIWISYAPTLTAGNAGTIGTSATSGRYKYLDDMLFIELLAAISGLGTAAGTVIFALPTGVTSGALNQAMCGRENTTGKAATATIGGSGTTIAATFYDNTTMWANGNSVLLTGTLQINS